MKLVWARYALEDSDIIFSYIGREIRGRRSTSTKRLSVLHIMVA